MKTAIITIIVIVFFLATAVLGLRSCQRAGWGSSLYGPYMGEAFTDDLTDSPVSLLPIPSVGMLEVYELPSHTNPVLVLRSESGAIQWSRLIVPDQRFGDGPVKRANVRELRLKRLEPTGSGHKVFFTCDWDWGGREAGLINLDGEYRFKSFRISW